MYRHVSVCVCALIRAVGYLAVAFWHWHCKHSLSAPLHFVSGPLLAAVRVRIDTKFLCRRRRLRRRSRPPLSVVVCRMTMAFRGYRRVCAHRSRAVPAFALPDTQAHMRTIITAYILDKRHILGQRACGRCAARVQKRANGARTPERDREPPRGLCRRFCGTHIGVIRFEYICFIAYWSAQTNTTYY